MQDLKFNQKLIISINQNATNSLHGRACFIQTFKQARAFSFDSILLLKLETDPIGHQVAALKPEARGECSGEYASITGRPPVGWGKAYQCSRGPTKSEHPWNRTEPESDQRKR